MDSLSNKNDAKTVRTLFRSSNPFVRYFLLPITEGLYGFSFIIALIFIVKWLSSPLGVSQVFAVDIIEIKLSLTGFFLMFVLCLIDNINSKKEQLEDSLTI